MQGQRSQRAVAAAEMDYARQQFYPTPSVSIEQVSAGQRDPSYLQNATVKVFRLQQPLWTNGRLTAGVAKAQASAEMAEQSYDDVRQQLALRVLQAWADGYGAELKQHALQTSLATHERLQAQVSRRVADGASAQTERVLTDGRLAQTRAQLQAVAVQAQTARMRLEQLSGAPVGAALVAAPEPELQVSDAAQALELAQQRSPAVRRLAAVVRMQEADVAERKGDLLPEVYARAEYQMGSASIAGAPDARDLIVDSDLSLNPDGSVGRLQMTPGTAAHAAGNGYTRAAAEAASRAIYQCQPYRLPPDRYALWREINPLRFDPRQMMGQ